MKKDSQLGLAVTLPTLALALTMTFYLESVEPINLGVDWFTIGLGYDRCEECHYWVDVGYPNGTHVWTGGLTKEKASLYYQSAIISSDFDKVKTNLFEDTINWNTTMSISDTFAVKEMRIEKP